MIRKLMAIAGLSALGVFLVPGAALAYTAPDSGDLRLLIQPNEIRLGDTSVPFESQQLMPDSDARFSITAPRVTSDHIPLTVTESGEGAGEEARGNVATTTTDEGKYAVAAVLPEVGVYTITSEGTDLNGDPSTLSLQFKVGALASDDPTNSLSVLPLVGGAALALVGGGFFVVSRRRKHEEDAAAMPA